MTDLFMIREADICPTGLYRWWLLRVWDDRLPLLIIVMLNPSTADAERDDPTVLALIHFAKLWGYGGLRIVNLFAWRASQPAEMLKAADPIGDSNGLHIGTAISYARETTGRILVAWGNGGHHLDQDERFIARARSAGVELVCLGMTQDCSPKHPMARGRHRIPRDQQPIIWRAA